MILAKEYSKKQNEKEIKVLLGISNDFIYFSLIEGIDTFNGQFSLMELQSKDKYFRMFDTIEEAYKELLTSFNENQYSTIIQENNLILNVEVEHSHKKNIIPFLLERKETKKEDLIKSLYTLANNYIKENYGLKQDIKDLNNKVNKIEELELKINSIESKIDQLIEYMKEKKEKEEEKKLIFENALNKSKIIEDNNQISLLKSWLPFSNKQNLKCKLIYDAKRDGDKASIFHSLCDYKESTLTIISTSDGKKIGGFLLKSFGGNRGYINDNYSFLFSLNYNEKYPSLNKGNNYNDVINKGPIFGSVCINIEDNFLINPTNFYHPYTCRYDFGKRNNNRNFNFKVVST